VAMILVQNQTLRSHALGNFTQLVRDITIDPAMLEWLDGARNSIPAPNENYARELMELHTLGVNGGYTQTDVHEVARCFTGWTYYGGSSGASSYTFRFNSGVHDSGQKTVLGNIIPARSGSSGQQDGDDVLNILINHPSTRSFIAGKLLRHFYADASPQGLIDSVAGVYQATGGDIRSMLNTVLHAAIQADAPLKFKRPLHLLASSLRALNATITTPNNLQTPLVSAGHSPFNWQSPDGYPDALGPWSGLLLARWNFGASLMNNEWYNTTSHLGVNVSQSYVVGSARLATDIVAAIDTALFNGTLSNLEKTQLRTYLLPDPPTSSRIREALGLAVSMPSFQWY